MRTRARIVAGAVAASLIGTLTACSGGAGDGSGSGGEGTREINVILNGNPNGKALEALAGEFNKSSDIKVNLQVLAEQQMRDKVQLNLQSKSSAMDVFMTLPSREGPLFEAYGYYEPLEPYIAGAPAEYEGGGFAPAAIAGMAINGKTVAVPMNVEGPVMFYRKDLLAAKDLKAPETIDDLIAAAGTLKDASGGAYVPVTLRGAASPLAFTFGPFFHAEGLKWTTDGRPNFDDPRATKAIGQYATLARDFGPPGVINYSFNESTNLFAGGGAAIALESSNVLATVIDPSTSKVVDNVGVASMPGGPNGSTPTVLSWGLSISPFSPNKDAAWEFVQWSTSPEAQLAMALEGIAPPRTALFDDKGYVQSLDTDAKKEWRDALLYILEKGDTEVGPVGKQAPAMRQVLGDGVGQAILGSLTAEQAAKLIQEQLTPLLNA